MSEKIYWRIWHLIWVYTVGSNPSVPLFRVNMETISIKQPWSCFYAGFFFFFFFFLFFFFFANIWQVARICEGILVTGIVCWNADLWNTIIILIVETDRPEWTVRPRSDTAKFCFWSGSALSVSLVDTSTGSKMGLFKYLDKYKKELTHVLLNKLSCHAHF